MGRLLLLLLGMVLFGCAYGQDNGRVVKKPVIDTMLTDVFTGNLPFAETVCKIYLQLNHCRYCDMGTYSFLATPHMGKSKSHAQIEGDWTVLKGSATDDNATVVELDDKNQKPIYYYLRLKNGDLQQLDSTLHEMKPVAKHKLTKQAKTAGR